MKAKDFLPRYNLPMDGIDPETELSWYERQFMLVGGWIAWWFGFMRGWFVLNVYYGGDELEYIKSLPKEELDEILRQIEQEERENNS
jgi:hypothetical protein